MQKKLRCQGSHVLQAKIEPSAPNSLEIALEAAFSLHISRASYIKYAGLLTQQVEPAIAFNLRQADGHLT